MAQISSVKITPTKIQQIMEAGRRQLSPEEFEELSSLLFDLEIYGLTPWINAELGKLMAKIEWELEIEPSPEWSKALEACDYAFLGTELRDMCRDAFLSPVGHKKQLCARLYNANVPEVVAVMEPYLKEMSPERIKREIERFAQTTREENPQRTTTMEERYTIDCSYCGFLATERTLNEALATARRLTGRHHTLEEKITIFDRLAQRGACQIYDIEGHCIGHKPFKGPEGLPQSPPYVSTVREVKDRLGELHRTAPAEFYQRQSLIQQAIKEREKGYQRTMPELTLDELKEVLRFTNQLCR